MNTSNQIQPWHREAATDYQRKYKGWFLYDATMPTKPSLAAIIAAHDPHQETVRLLEAALPFVWDAGCHSLLTAEIRAHLSRVKGGAQ